MTEPGRRGRRSGRTGPGVDSGARRGARQALLVVAVMAAAVVAAVVLERTGPERDATAARRVTAAPAIPSSDALSVSWYCPEGSATEGGRADEVVIVGNLADEEAPAVVTVFSDGSGEPVRERIDVPAGQQVEVELADIAGEEELLPEGTIAGPGVMVEAFGGQVVVEHAISRADDIAVGPCARGASTEWFFAAGTTVRGTELHLSLLNPFGDDAIVDLIFLTEDGVQTPEGAEALVVPRRSRVAVPVHELVPRQEQVATVVRTRTGRIVAEQSLASDGSEIPAGVALSLGATVPSRSWVFPAGAAADNGTQTVSVANFADTGTQAEVGIRGDNGDPIDQQTISIPARSATAVDTGALVPDDSAYTVEIHATGNEPVVAEALVTAVGEAETGLSLDFGAPVGARRWVFAEPTGADVEDATVSVLNPGPGPVTVSLLGATENGRDSSGGAAPRRLGAGELVVFETDDLEMLSGPLVVVEADGQVYVSRLLVTGTGRSLDPGIPER